MGKLAHFNLDNMLRLFHLRHFVETGTGSGDSLRVACRHPFGQLWSCDIEPTLIQSVQPTVADDRVHLFVGRSVQMLDLLSAFPADEPILFWLDAHFPGADCGLRGYGDESNEMIRLPLRQELALIKQHRPAHQDVIIIDDARLWVDGPFQAIREDLVPLCMPSERGVEFIVELFDASHTLTVVTDNEGYIVLTPK